MTNPQLTELRLFHRLRLFRSFLSGIVDLFPFSIVEPYLIVTCTFLDLRNHRRVALESPGCLIPLGNTVSTERPGKAARNLIPSVSPRVVVA